MTPAEHKAKAEEILSQLDQLQEELDGEGGFASAAVVAALTQTVDWALQRAQIHATLATVPDPT